MRALLATAGLLVLAGVGSAAAGKPTAHTLRKNTTGPIEAVAQDGTFAAWLSSGGTRACDAVHVLSPHKPDRTLPKPSSGTMTCNWTLTDGRPQLAFASRISTALWTLHESGPAPFDFVLAASIGGPERRLDRLAHASDGTGRWLGGVAGAGKTLAYSWDDVEYVDSQGCLSGGSCKEKIADGGIRLVSRATATPLPGAGPALALAAAAGRLAYIPATKAGKNGRPEASAGSTLQILDGTTGEVVSQVVVHALPLAIALSTHVFGVLTQNGHHDKVSWYDPATGTKLGSVSISRKAAPQLAASDQLLVYKVGRLLHRIAAHGGRSRKLVKTAPGAIGLSLARGRLLWIENRGNVGRLRAVAVS